MAALAAYLGVMRTFRCPTAEAVAMRHFLAALIVAGGLVQPCLARGTTSSQVTPSVSSSCGGNAWFAYISPPGHPQSVYELRLLPTVDVSGHVVGWDLELSPASDRDANLLEPSGNWHGLQPFNFLGRDFVDGARGSPFGAKRRIPVRGTSNSLVVNVKSSDGTETEAKALSLQVQLE